MGTNPDERKPLRFFLSDVFRSARTCFPSVQGWTEILIINLRKQRRIIGLGARGRALIHTVENIPAGLEKFNPMIVLKEGRLPLVWNPATFAFPVIRTALASIREQEPSRLA